MDRVLLISMLMDFMFAVVAVFGSWAVLRGLDLLVGVPMRDWLATSDDLGRGIYYSARILAVAFLMGTILG